MFADDRFNKQKLILANPVIFEKKRNTCSVLRTVSGIKIDLIGVEEVLYS